MPAAAMGVRNIVKMKNKVNEVATSWNASRIFLIRNIQIGNIMGVKQLFKKNVKKLQKIL